MAVEVQVEQANDWIAAGPAAEDVAHELAQSRRVKMLLEQSGLPAIPEVYELLWRYVADRDHALSHAVDVALSLGTFDLATVAALRGQHRSD